MKKVILLALTASYVSLIVSAALVSSDWTILGLLSIPLFGLILMTLEDLLLIRLSVRRRKEPDEQTSDEHEQELRRIWRKMQWLPLGM